MRSGMIGNKGLMLAIMLACAMSAIEFFIGTPQRLEGELGICFPSPNLWTINPLVSWIVNLGLILILGLSLHLFNKTYNFISSSDTVLPAAFIFLCGSNPWIDSVLTSSVILMGANFACLHFLFGCYRSNKSTQQMFIVGSILALGSMFQYAFVFFIPAYLIIAMVLKCMNIKSLLAYIMGVAAPYWIGIGIGLIPLDSFSMPTFTNLFDGFGSKQTIFVGLLNCAVTIILSTMLALYNAVKLYAGNTRRRLLNNSIIILGIASAISIVCDVDNIQVYMATVYLVAGVQLANLFALRQVRHTHTFIFFFVMLYIASYVLMETGFYLPA
ncbi:hypothetical protein IMSAGC016_01187 [Muribaculaceae bacterium]|jgi:hypothetical protein|nr:hypothetical protein IMSAGC016_01187 [Muribaculaceae bacterium]